MLFRSDCSSLESMCYFFHGLGLPGGVDAPVSQSFVYDGATKPGAESPDICCSILRSLVLSVSQQLSLGQRKGKAGWGK